MMEKERIGIYGGSFNPVHNGHLHLAAAAMKQFSLSRVIFVPAYVSPFKQNSRGETTAMDDAHRLAMLRLAVQDEPCFSVSDYELERADVSYTVYTLRHFRQLYPDAELVLLMGSDMLLSFDKWYCWQEILQLAEIGAVARTPEDVASTEEKTAALSAYGRVSCFCGEIYPISSTDIRSLLKKNTDCSCYLPQKVVEYIVSNDLYR